MIGMFATQNRNNVIKPSDIHGNLIWMDTVSIETYEDAGINEDRIDYYDNLGTGGPSVLNTYVTRRPAYEGPAYMTSEGTLGFLINGYRTGNFKGNFDPNRTSYNSIDLAWNSAITDNIIEAVTIPQTPQFTFFSVISSANTESAGGPERLFAIRTADGGYLALTIKSIRDGNNYKWWDEVSVYKYGSDTTQAGALIASTIVDKVGSVYTDFGLYTTPYVVSLTNSYLYINGVIVATLSDVSYSVIDSYYSMFVDPDKGFSGLAWYQGLMVETVFYGVGLTSGQHEGVANWLLEKYAIE